MIAIDRGGRGVGVYTKKLIPTLDNLQAKKRNGNNPGMAKDQRRTTNDGNAGSCKTKRTAEKDNVAYREPYPMAAR